MPPQDLKRLVTIVAVCAIIGLGGGGALAYGVMSSMRPAAPAPAPAPAPPKPTLTEGFATSAGRPAVEPPIDPLREPPSADDAPEAPSEPVVLERVDADIEIGIGRAAVIQLDVRPLAFRTDPYPLDITALPPYIALSASRSGSFLLTVEHEGGERQWTVSVHGSSLADPEGEGLVATTERLELPAGGTVVCGLDVATASLVVVDPSTADLVPLDDRAVVVESYAKAVADVVVEQPRKAPRILTVDGTVDEVGKLPAGCRAPEGPLRVPAGGEMSVPTGISLSALHVADEKIVEATRADESPRSVVLRPLRRGETMVAASDGRGGTWIARVIVD